MLCGTMRRQCLHGYDRNRSLAMLSRRKGFLPTSANLDLETGITSHLKSHPSMHWLISICAFGSMITVQIKSPGYACNML